MILPSKIPGGAELMNAEEVLKTAGIEEKMKVADFGCGAKGYFSLQAAKLVGKDGFVYAFDILKSVLQAVSNLSRLHGFKNIETRWADLEVYQSTKLAEESVDFVIITNLFFQTKKHDIILKEAHRILRKNGKIFLADWGKTASPLGPPVELRVKPEEVKNLALSLGFALEKEFAAGPYHFGLVLVKK
ncbi:MAG: class I SAM-dependent methyltransferase [Patescibacteria group bacterium]|nr:class I SAM-dependent methyltransferase [Patescibacteria group bacterium]